ncbi:MAG: hypothetical protein Q9164_006385, partial [Protoblastenia rupestris]
MSDLHLETPFARQTYEEFNIERCSPYLVLLGDIGHIYDDRLFIFLERQLRQFDTVFYLIGNHEPYGMTLPDAKAKIEAFARKMEQLRTTTSILGTFVHLDKTRYDITDSFTILGCTLHSNILPEQKGQVRLFVSDFSNIKDWTIAQHNEAHVSDLIWLNSQVMEIQRTESGRKIVIFTHHSPTILEAASGPKHREDAAQ